MIWNEFALKMDTRLLKILEQETAKEKAKKKKKSIFKLKKEKSIMYYSGWHKDDKPVNKEAESEKQTKLKQALKKTIPNLNCNLNKNA